MTPFVRTLANPIGLWAGFVLAHLWLIWLGVVVTPGSLGDVSGVYRFWVENGLRGVFVAGITTAWVYPPLALVPLFIPAIAGLNNYVMAWLIMATIGDLIAFFYLVRGFSKPAPRALAAWWWTGALIALGPVALGRLDSVVTPLAVWALLFVLTRPRLAGVLMALGAWIKVWPGAIVIAAVVLVQRRWRILTAFAVCSAVVLAAALVAGSGLNALSFVAYQSNRGLQIESPAATVFMWITSMRTGTTEVYFDGEMLTYQVQGPGVAQVASVMTLVMGLAVLATLFCAWRATRRTATSALSSVKLMPATTLALVMALIAFNKVGSPQYFVWVIPPVVAGLVIDRVRFAPLAAFTLVALLLTQVIYPWVYDDIVNTHAVALVILTVRNALEIVLFGWALALVIRPGSRASVRAELPLRHSR